MSGPLDGRDAEKLYGELLRRAVALLSPDGQAAAPGRIETALLGVAGRIGEEVTRRLDKVPDKQADNFYTAMGIGRDPAQPARVPIAIRLSDTAPGGRVATAGTRFSADAGGTTASFETEDGITLTRGSIVRLCAVDAARDRIFVSPSAVIHGPLPRPAVVPRTLRAGAGPGATVLQLDPATGIEAGMTLRLGAGADARDHLVAAVEGDLVTIAPPLDATLDKGGIAIEVAHFAPFEAGAHDRQSHALYLSHSTLLDVPSAIDILVEGVEPQGEVVWEWFGTRDPDEEPAWQTFTSASFETGRWVLKKPSGKPGQTEIEGRTALWIRARLPGASGGETEARNVRIAVAGSGLCGEDHHQRCEEQARAGEGASGGQDDGAPPKIDYEAIAVTTPVVPNKPYHPFGLEPRLFDSFYIGCAEAFGKVGAEVSLCFTMGGPSLGPMAAVRHGISLELFGVGTDGQLYRAVFAGGPPAFAPVPGPREGSSSAVFPPQAAVAARIDGGKVRVAVGDIGAVHVARFDHGAPLTEGSIDWRRLSAGTEDVDSPIRAIFLGNDDKASVHALAGARLLVWSTDTGPSTPAVTQGAIDLLPVQGTGIDAALRIVSANGKTRIAVQRAGEPGPAEIATVDSDELPAERLSAWARSDDAQNDRFFVAGFDPTDDEEDSQRSLRLVVIEAGDATDIPIDSKLIEPFPIGFEPPLDRSDGPPTMVLASARPMRFVALAGRLRRSADPSDIGASTNIERRVLTVGNRTIVQHGEQGLLYRSADGDRSLGEISFAGAARFVADRATVPAGAEYLVFDSAPNMGFRLAANRGGDVVLLPLQEETQPDPESPARFFTGGSEHGSVGTSSDHVFLRSTRPDRDVDILLTVRSVGGAITTSIWHLILDPDPAVDGWLKPAGFPSANVASMDYRTLDPMLDAGLPIMANLTLHDYFQPLDPPALAARLSRGLLQSYYSSDRFDRLEDFDGVQVLRADHQLLDAGFIRFAEPPAAWTPLGPNQPANPDLSWEYWNGTSWWALDTAGLHDRTANLLINGGVFFTVPADLEETEVGGRTNRWIRARLVGGDYGEARVTVTSTPAGNGKTEQTVTRDLSAIRAPFVVDLKLGYCLAAPVRPEIILTADNLGAIDQTNANDADLPFALFPPVSSAMRSIPSPAAAASVAGDCCEEMAEPGSAEAETQAPELPFSRALLIGLERPEAGDAVSFYADAAPVGGLRTLTAQVYRDGRFVPARIVKDTTSGLGESGTIAIDIPEPPSLIGMFGASAHWLRLSVDGPAGETWAPNIRGLHLNGVMAASVETRAMESVGTSSGVPDQEFRLAAAPLDPDSLELRVVERIGDDEAKRLGAPLEIEGMRGPWVPWQMAPELPAGDQEHPGRLFTLDAESGTLRFGNGRNALIPPMGSAILARSYRRVTGAAANQIAAGAQLQPVSSIVGVDRVIALDSAQGGADVEQAAETRLRAPAKVRHGGRIVSLADIEEFVRARIPSVAQARAFNRRGGIGLVIVGKGTKLRPTPSFLRAAEQGVREAAAFAVGAPGRLTAFAPRLLPVEIKVEIDPHPGIDAAGLLAEAEGRIVRWFDHETGGSDGRGWPIGLPPSKSEVAAALACIADRGVVTGVTVTRADNDLPLPEPFPPDMLARVEPADVRVARESEAAA